MRHPDELVRDTEAYKTRRNGSIHPRARLSEFCELASFQDANSGLLYPGDMDIPGAPIQSTYAYWGISPKGGRKKRDIAVHDYWMESELTWLRANGPQVRPYFDDVSSMGWHSSIRSLSLTIDFAEGVIGRAEYVRQSMKTISDAEKRY